MQLTWQMYADGNDGNVIPNDGTKPPDLPGEFPSPKGNDLEHDNPSGRRLMSLHAEWPNCMPKRQSEFSPGH